MPHFCFVGRSQQTSGPSRKLTAVVSQYCTIAEDTMKQKKEEDDDTNAVEAMETQQQQQQQELLLMPVVPVSRKLHARSASSQVAAAAAVPMETITIGGDEPPRSDGSFVGKQLVLMHHFKAGVETWCDKFAVAVALTAWYVVGVFAIVTTKLLLQDWHCPPIVLTVQQMVLGAGILHMVVAARDGAAQPWPWQVAVPHSKTTAKKSKRHNKNLHQPPHAAQTQSATNATERVAIENELLLDRMKRYLPWLKHPYFILSGVCNALDFAASNYAFSFSSAHFVETIKASEPITTTAIALFWNVDRLSTTEAASLSMLIAGVFLSTWGNTTDEQDTKISNDNKLTESIQTASLALAANLFFGFRAMNQKKYRSTTHETQQMDDVNFLCRIMQVGAIFLLFPLALLHLPAMAEALSQPSENQFSYLGLSVVNAFSYVTYK